MSNELDRRSFFKTAAAAAAMGPAVLTGCATTQAGRAAPSERVTVGAIGLGWQGPANMGDFLKRTDVQVVAVCDVDDNHLNRAKETVNNTYENQDCATYKHFEELLARNDLDAVTIALPDHWHAIPAIAAAEAGLDIHGEKPLAHTVMEGRAICNAVKRNNRIWQTGSWQRSVENFHHAAELVRNGRIGKVEYIEVGLGQGYSDYAETQDQTAFSTPPAELDYDRWLGPAPFAPYCPARVHKNWRWVLDYGGGRILDWVGHHLDIAHWGMGLDETGPVWVAGNGRIPELGAWDTPTDYKCTCKYRDGLEISISSEHPMGVKWVGEDGWIFVTRGETNAEPASVLDEVIGEDEIRLYHSRDHIGNFVECVKSRRETITPCEVAHRSATVGHLCNIAIFTGRTIQWNPDTEEIIDDPVASKMLYPIYRGPWGIRI